MTWQNDLRDKLTDDYLQRKTLKELVDEAFSCKNDQGEQPETSEVLEIFDQKIEQYLGSRYNDHDNNVQYGVNFKSLTLATTSGVSNKSFYQQTVDQFVDSNIAKFNGYLAQDSNIQKLLKCGNRNIINFGDYDGQSGGCYNPKNNVLTLKLDTPDILKFTSMKKKSKEEESKEVDPNIPVIIHELIHKIDCDNAILSQIINKFANNLLTKISGQKQDLVQYRSDVLALAKDIAKFFDKKIGSYIDQRLEKNLARASSIEDINKCFNHDFVHEIIPNLVELCYGKTDSDVQKQLELKIEFPLAVEMTKKITQSIGTPTYSITSSLYKLLYDSSKKEREASASKLDEDLKYISEQCTILKEEAQIFENYFQQINIFFEEYNNEFRSVLKVEEHQEEPLLAKIVTKFPISYENAADKSKKSVQSRIDRLKKFVEPDGQEKMFSTVNGKIIDKALDNHLGKQKKEGKVDLSTIQQLSTEDLFPERTLKRARILPHVTTPQSVYDSLEEALKQDIKLVTDNLGNQTLQFRLSSSSDGSENWVTMSYNQLVLIENISSSNGNAQEKQQLILNIASNPSSHLRLATKSDLAENTKTYKPNLKQILEHHYQSLDSQEKLQLEELTETITLSETKSIQDSNDIFSSPNNQQEKQNPSTKPQIHLLPESDHQTDHPNHIKNLLAHIGSLPTPQEGKTNNIVIALERKQEGKNLGMPDVILLAKLIKKEEELNQAKSDDPTPISLIPDNVRNSLIYQDALLYKAAEPKGIKVIGIDKAKITAQKKTDYKGYNHEREEHMVEKLIAISNNHPNHNIIFPVGSSHIESISKSIEVKSLSVVITNSINNHKTIKKTTDFAVSLNTELDTTTEALKASLQKLHEQKYKQVVEPEKPKTSRNSTQEDADTTKSHVDRERPTFRVNLKARLK